jgi:hypothetical protein
MRANQFDGEIIFSQYIFSQYIFSQYMFSQYMFSQYIFIRACCYGSLIITLKKKEDL